MDPKSTPDGSLASNASLLFVRSVGSTEIRVSASGSSGAGGHGNYFYGSPVIEHAAATEVSNVSLPTFLLSIIETCHADQEPSSEMASQLPLYTPRFGRVGTLVYVIH